MRRDSERQRERKRGSSVRGMANKTRQVGPGGGNRGLQQINRGNETTAANKKWRSQSKQPPREMKSAGQPTNANSRAPPSPSLRKVV